MNESFLDEDVPERYVEHVESIFSVDTVNSIECDVLRKLTINDLIKEPHEDPFSRNFMNQMVGKYSYYLLNN